MSRIHFLVAGEDKLRYENQASREGLSLGAWLREAAEERYQSAQARAPFASAEEVEAFFTECDRQNGDAESEPDWDAHLQVLDSSRRSGIEST